MHEEDTDIIKSGVQASAIEGQARAYERKESSETTPELREKILQGIVPEMLDYAGNNCPHENTKRAPKYDVPGVITYVCEDCGAHNFVNIYDDFL